MYQLFHRLSGRRSPMASSHPFHMTLSREAGTMTGLSLFLGGMTMSCRNVMRMALALVLTMAVVGLARAADTPKGKKAASPEEAVKALVQAAKDGDNDATLAQLAEPARSLYETWL